VSETEATRPKPSHVPGRHVCQTCRRILSYDEATGQYVHPQEHLHWDHAPVAVPDLEFLYINEKCDFCFADTSAWVLPAEPFVIAPGHGSDGDWAACEACAELIRADAWYKLLQLVRKRWPEAHSGNRMPPETAQLHHLLWQELRTHVTGQLQRIER